MIYKDSGQSPEKRAADLLSRMTVEEKIAQLSGGRMGDFLSEELAREKLPLSIGHLGRLGGATDQEPHEVARLGNRIQKHFVENTRLGIPVMFLTEATSGVLSRDHTLFPMNIAQGAMFDEEIVEAIGDVTRREMCATGERMALAPVVDVIRDHRYGRYEESYGEDVYLAALKGMAFTRGLQGEDLSRGAAATLKHFAAQGISDGGRNTAPIHLADREFYDQYIAPFEAVIQECDPAAVMAAYHELDGVPVHASRRVLTEILKEKLGFKGLLMSDGNGVQLVKTFHDYCETLEETVELTLNAGIEMELDYIWREHLSDRLSQGRVDQKTLDQSVLKMLTLKFKLGLFDRPYVDEGGTVLVGCSDHLRVAREAAEKVMTLLENKKGVLPLDGRFKRVAVTGPLAHVKHFAYGDYSYPTHIEDMYHQSEGMDEDEAIARTLFFKKRDTSYDDLFRDNATILEALRAVSPETEFLYAPGIKDTTNYTDDPDFADFTALRAVLDQADGVIAVCGDTSGMGFQNDSGESVDRATIGLSREQKELLGICREAGKPLILVLSNGRPLEIREEAEFCDAILESWKPGWGGAEAIARTLYGQLNPGGRLPVTLPKMLGQLPIYYSQRRTGKKQFWRETYVETDLEPLYPFGYGLGYTDFSYGDVSFEQRDDRIRVEARITNTGDRAGDEVFQVYARKRYVSVSQPERELKGFKRVTLAPGESVRVSLDLFYDSLAYHDLEYKLALEDMTLDVMIGRNARDILEERTFKVEFPGSVRYPEKRVFVNPVRVIRMKK